jgi:hypothetical protein
MTDSGKGKIDDRGYWVGDADEFLGLEPYESAIVDLRLRLSRGIKAARDARRMTRAALARAMESTQSQAAKAEDGSMEVPIELMLRALYAAGGSLTTLGFPGPPRESEAAGREGGGADAPSRKGKGRKVVGA